MSGCSAQAQVEHMQLLHRQQQLCHMYVKELFQRVKRGNGQGRASRCRTRTVKDTVRSLPSFIINNLRLPRIRSVHTSNL
jgi:hypothetical protein